VPLHIVQRGHNRAYCFFCEEDYHCYLYWLTNALKAHGAALHAYVLMTNHVHLLVSAPDPQAVPHVFMSLGRRYVQYINRTYRRTGTLWENRYRSSLIDSETYLLVCQRYIELNPVRACMVDNPAQYAWSSYRFHALGARNELVTPRPEYLALGNNRTSREQAYRALFQQALDQTVIADIRLALNQCQPLGDSAFRAMVESAGRP